MKSTIFMVSCNTIDPSDNTILGFYPTLELAEARKAEILADPDYSDEANESDMRVGIMQIPVGANGADVSIQLR